MFVATEVCSGCLVRFVQTVVRSGSKVWGFYPASEMEQ